MRLDSATGNIKRAHVIFLFLLSHLDSSILFKYGPNLGDLVIALFYFPVANQEVGGVGSFHEVTHSPSKGSKIGSEFLL